jgi:hypothetical protein
MNQGAGFRGRPPRLPFSRAARAFASERTLPPFLPSETAAGFLRCTDKLRSQHPLSARGKFDVARRQVLGRDRDAVDLAGLAVDATVPVGVEDRDPVASLEVRFHIPIKPNRLGFVKWVAV